MKRSSLIEGVAVLRMSVPTTKCVGDNIGIAGNVKCAKFRCSGCQCEPKFVGHAAHRTIT